MKPDKWLTYPCGCGYKFIDMQREPNAKWKMDLSTVKGGEYFLCNRHYNEMQES